MFCVLCNPGWLGPVEKPTHGEAGGRGHDHLVMRGDPEMHMWISVWEVENRFFQNAPPRFKVHVYC